MPFLVPPPIINEMPECIYRRMLLIITFLLVRENLDIDQKLSLHRILITKNYPHLKNSKIIKLNGYQVT
jgi:hypothetical protein